MLKLNHLNPTGGQGPITAGYFGHFYAYSPSELKETRNYAVGRYGMETQRLCSVLDNHLSSRLFLVGEEYSIADMICFPWFSGLKRGIYKFGGITCNDFLEIEKNYPSACAWADRINARPAVVRGLTVCGWNSDVTKPWLEGDKKEEI